MIEGPIGGAAYNNEFGRPNLAGYFRTFELASEGEVRGYHKPIMLAGGYGNISARHTHKHALGAGTLFIHLGGPSFLIGLGGGAASSMASGQNVESLDFDSVQRANAELERRCQEVIDACWQMGEANPILSIHDVGAGGLSNAMPELVHDAGLGADLDLRAIPTGEADLSPLELWCNEAQERYVLAIAPDRIDELAAICDRERAPWARLGHATSDGRLVLRDRDVNPVDVPLDLVLGKPPKMTRRAEPVSPARRPLDLGGASVADALDRVLGLPAVADKSFLVTIGDRTVGGLISRDSMVGPYQVPVADCAITLAGFDSYAGEVMALGERPPVALLDAAAASRLAIAEAVTNLAAAPIGELSNIKLSCNWMAAAGHPGEDARLYAAVRAASETAIALGVAIPVGKDSMSMRTVWRAPVASPLAGALEDSPGIGASLEAAAASLVPAFAVADAVADNALEQAAARAVVSPVTLVVTAFGPVRDVRMNVTPETYVGCDLYLVDLGGGQGRLGGSALAQVYNQLGDTPPDLDDPQRLVRFFDAMQRVVRHGAIASYHDRSDGGLVVTVLEMAFASGVGLELDTTAVHADPFAALFAEELGAVIAIMPNPRELGEQWGVAQIRAAGLPMIPIGRTIPGDRVTIRHGGAKVVDTTRSALRARWSHVSHAIASRR
ncbi:MAG TPA: phosphoribosylformylglycinamidine synthase, partial [Kofleriaceae bacterium]|nr:phosphoribosylformylglycinamidine synthase [Kofleriaceae bacterium]